MVARPLVEFVASAAQVWLRCVATPLATAKLLINGLISLWTAWGWL